jgi:hypothetical protein
MRTFRDANRETTCMSCRAKAISGLVISNADLGTAVGFRKQFAAMENRKRTSGRTMQTVVNRDD